MTGVGFAALFAKRAGDLRRARNFGENFTAALVNRGLLAPYGFAQVVIAVRLYPILCAASENPSSRVRARRLLRLASHLTLLASLARPPAHPPHPHPPPPPSPSSPRRAAGSDAVADALVANITQARGHSPYIFSQLVDRPAVAGVPHELR